jgi:hypothetical protein
MTMDELLELIALYELMLSQPENLVFESTIPVLKQNIITLWQEHVG